MEWQVRSSTKSMLTVFLFSTWRGSFTVNLFLLTLWSTLTFTLTFWDAWQRICDVKGRKFGAATTGSITTLPPTRPWKL
jgi:hypothetical protein